MATPTRPLPLLVTSTPSVTVAITTIRKQDGTISIPDAHPTYEEISLAVDKLGKKSSPSAVKLLNKSRPYNKYGYEISNLPEYELINAFDILLVVLSISDNRRRLEECSNGCNHWWHMDLSDKAVVQWLRQNYS